MNPITYLLEVNAAGHERINTIIEAEVTLPNREYHLVEVDRDGKIIDPVVPFQIDQSALVFLVKGTTPVNTVRRFHLTGGAAAEVASPLLTVTAGVEHQGQESFKIAAQNATYYYHKFGAGFASMIDVEGNDWLSYRPYGGSDGKYRGIPNIVHPEGHFHPGGTECTSEIVQQGPVKLMIRSRSIDNKWACSWAIYPYHARLTVLKVDHPYWFLYEGTPGGKLDETGDYMVRSDGVRIPASESWEAVLPEPEWIYFGAANTGRVLYLIHHEADDKIDSYWPMEHNMTVFGFGRDGLEKYMTRTPAHFTIGFAESGDYEAAKKVIDTALCPATVSVSRLT